MVEQAGFPVYDMGGNTSYATPERRPLFVMDMQKVEWAVREAFGNRIARERSVAIFDRASTWKPDLIVCDEMDFGAMIAAERLDVPYASVLVIASGQLTRTEWLAEPLNRLRSENGLPPDPELTMLHRHLVLYPFAPSLRDPQRPLPQTGYSFRPAPSPLGEAPSWLQPPPPGQTVYVSLGTQFNLTSGDLFERILNGLRDLPVTVVATVGANINPQELGPQPANIRIECFVDQAFLLPHCDLVISHAGSGSVGATLAHGLPLLLFPLASDQIFNGRRCEELGVAQVLDPAQATSMMVQDSVRFLLSEAAQPRQRARQIQQEYADLPAQQTAVALLEQLAYRKAPILSN